MRVIGGFLRRHALRVPQTPLLRPTAGRLRELLFNLLPPIDGRKVLDLFSGSGSIGIEALSRGAKGVVFVEKEPSLIRCLKKNLTEMRLLNSSSILSMDVKRALFYLIKKGTAFDYIYVDPPYCRQDLLNETLLLLQNSSLLSPQGWLCIEVDKRTKLPHLFPARCSDHRRVGDSSLHLYRPSAH